VDADRVCVPSFFSSLFPLFRGERSRKRGAGRHVSPIPLPSSFLPPPFPSLFVKIRFGRTRKHKGPTCSSPGGLPPSLFPFGGCSRRRLPAEDGRPALAASIFSPFFSSPPLLLSFHPGDRRQRLHGGSTPAPLRAGSLVGPPFFPLFFFFFVRQNSSCRSRGLTRRGTRMVSFFLFFPSSFFLLSLEW